MVRKKHCHRDFLKCIFLQGFFARLKVKAGLVMALNFLNTLEKSMNCLENDSNVLVDVLVRVVGTVCDWNRWSRRWIRSWRWGRSALFIVLMTQCQMCCQQNDSVMLLIKNVSSSPHSQFFLQCCQCNRELSWHIKALDWNDTAIYPALFRAEFVSGTVLSTFTELNAFQLISAFVGYKLHWPYYCHHLL